MPELPEVEVVRRGIADHVAGRVVSTVEVRHPRAVRKHLPGPRDFEARVSGKRIRAARRRGKYLWLELGDGQPVPAASESPAKSVPVASEFAGTAGGGEAVLTHLGMSGQLLVQPPGTPDEKHLRVRFRFEDGGPELRFVDQRTFGGLSLADLVRIDGHPTNGRRIVGGYPDDGQTDGAGAGSAGSVDHAVDGAGAGAYGVDVPTPIAHIAPDPLEPSFDLQALVEKMRARSTNAKRGLLDQSLVSGIGNIYADEALWRAQLHWARPTATLTRPAVRRLIGAVTEVMGDALAAGGTSFDDLYVNVNGESGYFDRSLAVYGQAGWPCPRCGASVRRDSFMNRSSYTCPSCQPRPRNPHW